MLYLFFVFIIPFIPVNSEYLDQTNDMKLVFVQMVWANFSLRLKQIEFQMWRHGKFFKKII